MWFPSVQHISQTVSPFVLDVPAGGRDTLPEDAQGVDSEACMVAAGTRVGKKRRVQVEHPGASW
eukprot:7940490-Pyramimonas_sp.AAC.1